VGKCGIMLQHNTQYIQTKIVLDDGLSPTWDYLRKEYKVLDKSGIIRLALRSLEKETKKQAQKDQSDSFVYNSDSFKDEEEFSNWWTKHKHELRI
jgi:hypothetical protein